VSGHSTKAKNDIGWGRFVEFLRQLMGPGVAGVASLLVLFVPLALILLHRSGRWWSKLLWMLASQASWAFVGLYAWVRLVRYPEATLSPDQQAQLLTEFPLTDAIGWWTFVFPWVVYLLFRATHLPTSTPPTSEGQG